MNVENNSEDYEFKDEGEYVLVNSIETLFEAKPWRVPTVRVLRDSEGNPIAFAAISSSAHQTKFRKALPAEFFNHQLIDLDYSNPNKFASFMSEYGFIGASDRQNSRCNKSHRRTKLSNKIEEIDPTSTESIDRFEEDFGYMALHYPSELGYALHREQICDHYKELKTAFKKASKQLSDAQKNASPLERAVIGELISIDRAKYLFEDWLYCSKHIQAILLNRTVADLAKALNEDEYVVIRNCRGARNILQRHLEEAHPRLDIFNITENDWITGGDADLGSFEQALALQLWNFTIEAKNGFTVCKECGNAFVHKQTKSRKGNSRSTSQFCCDKCKNRFTQRKHRQTEGYKLKAKKKKNAGE